MSALILHLLGLWALGLLLYLGLRSGRLGSRRVVHLGLGALIVVHLWTTPLAREGSEAILSGSLAASNLGLAPPVVAPIICLTVLFVYVLDGVAAAASLLLGVSATLAAAGAGLPLLAALGGSLDPSMEAAPGLLAASGGLRTYLVEAGSMAVAGFIAVILLQALRNRTQGGVGSGTITLALLGAGWTQAALAALGRSSAGPLALGAVGAGWAGWALAALALWPVSLLMMRQGASPSSAGPTLAVRPATDILRSALELARPFRRRTDRAETLQQRLRWLTAVRQRIVRAEDELGLLADVASEIQRNPRIDGCWIGLVEAGAGRLVTAEAAGFGDLDLRPAAAQSPSSAGKEEVLPDEAVVLDWFRAQPDLAVLRRRADGRGSLEAVPVAGKAGCMGVLAVVSSAEGGMTTQDREWVRDIAEDLGRGLEQLRLQAQLSRQVRQLEAARSITTELISEHRVSELLAKIVAGALDLLEADSGRLYLVEPEAGAVRCVVRRGDAGIPEERMQVIGERVAGRVAREGHSSVDGHRESPRGRDVQLVTLASPLRWQGKVTGVLSLTRTRGSAFSERELEMLEMFADQAAVALQNARLIEAERRRSAELETLRQASLNLTSSLELGPVLEAILEQALTVVSAYDAHIFLYDGQELRFGAALWADEAQGEPFKEPRQDGLTANVARSGEKIVVESVLEHPLYEDVEWVWDGAIIGLPLAVGGRVLGVMNVAFDEPRAFDKEDLHILELLADQAAVVLENARLYDRTAAERRRLRLLYDMTRLITTSLDGEEILQRAAEVTVKNLGAVLGGANLIEPEGDRLPIVGLGGADRARIDELNRRLDLRVGRGFIGWVAEHEKPAMAANVQEDERWEPVPGFDDDVRSGMAAPIRVSGETIGVLSVFHRQAGVFDGEHLELLTALCQQVGLAWSNAERYRQVERRLAERTVLQQVAQVINSRLEMGPLLDEIVEQVRTVLGYSVVDIVLVEDNELVLHAGRGVEGGGQVRFSVEQGVTGRVVRTGDPAFVPEVESDPDYLGLVPDVVSEIAVPLRKGEVVIGALNVEALEPGALADEDVRLLSLLGDQISVAIENAALYDRLRRHTEELEAVVSERTAALEKALASARQADRLKTRFVSDVSHELRTPLSNIRLYVELLSSSTEERFDEYLATLGRETDRLVALIEDLLSISRLDAGSMPFRFEALDINRLSEALVRDRARLFSQRGLTLNWEPAEGDPHVRADEKLLSQVLANLMTNAMHYTPSGGEVSVGCEVEADEGWVKLIVADTGLGIRENERDQLFTRFFRGAASRKTGNPGTGLGLAICKEIMDRHDGRIAVESQEGRGSTFTIWLPAAKPGDEAAGAAANRMAGSSSRSEQ